MSYKTRTCHFYVASYHPGGQVSATRLDDFLEEMKHVAETLPAGHFEAVIGFSVGGLLAALFQEQHPGLVKRVVLMAPAIDNFARNFANSHPNQWFMPREYVEELRRMSSRPKIKVPALLIHGSLDDDNGGSALWRMQEWASEEQFHAIYFPESVGHSPAIVGVDGSPSWSELVQWAINPLSPSLPASSTKC